MASSHVKEAYQQVRVDVLALLGLHEKRASGQVEVTTLARARRQIHHQLGVFRRALYAAKQGCVGSSAVLPAPHESTEQSSPTGGMEKCSAALSTKQSRRSNEKAGPCGTRALSTVRHGSRQCTAPAADRNLDATKQVMFSPFFDRKFSHAFSACTEVSEGPSVRPVLQPVSPAVAQAAMKHRRGYTLLKDQRLPALKSEDGDGGNVPIGVEKTKVSEGVQAAGKRGKDPAEGIPSEGVEPGSAAQLECTLIFARECHEQVAVFLQLGLLEDARELFLMPLEEDIRLLREISTAFFPLFGGSNEALGEEKLKGGLTSARAVGESKDGSGRARDLVRKGGAPVADCELPLAVQAFHCVINHDLLLSVICFYETLNRDPYMDSMRETILSADAYIERVTRLLYRLASAKDFIGGNTPSVLSLYSRPSPFVGQYLVKDLVDVREGRARGVHSPDGSMRSEVLYSVVDSGYHIIFNGSIYIYEMCMYILRRVQNCSESNKENGSNLASIMYTVPEFYQMCVDHVSLSIELSEPRFYSVMKLGTVKYLPWRIQMFDFIAQCFEQEGCFGEALKVAYKAAQEVRFLQELEFTDPVPPSPQWLKTIATAAQHTTLQMMRYGWYDMIASSAQQGGASGSKAAGSQTPADNSPSSHTSNVSPAPASGQNSAGSGASSLIFCIQPDHAAVPQEAPVVLPVPRNGRELLQCMWRVMERTCLPVSATTNASEGEELVKGLLSSLKSVKKGGGTSLLTSEQLEKIKAVKKREEDARTLEISSSFQLHAISYLLGFLVVHSVECDEALTPIASGAAPNTTEQATNKVVRLNTASPGAKVKEASSNTNYVLTFKSMRSCALEGLEILLQYMSISYFIRPSIRAELFAAASYLFPFPVQYKDESSMALATEAYLEEATTVPLDEEETAHQNVKDPTGKKGAVKKAGKSSEHAKGNEKALLAALQKLAGPSGERLDITEDPVFVASVQFENYFPSLRPRSHHAERSGGGVCEAKGSEKPKKGCKAVSSQGSSNSLLVMEDSFQQELLLLVQLIRQFYSTKKDALFFRVCAMAGHAVRSTFLTPGFGPGGAKPHGKSEGARGVLDSRGTVKRSYSRAHFDIPKVWASKGSSLEDSLILEAASPNWSRLALSAQCMLRLLQALRYSTLTMRFQRSTLRVEEVLLQDDFFVPPQHPYLHFLVISSGEHARAAERIREANRALEGDGGESSLVGSRAKIKEGRKFTPTEDPVEVVTENLGKSKLFEYASSPPPVPSHPYPLVSPLAPTAAALKVLANAVGSSGASTRSFPEVPILAATASISVAVASLYEDVIDMVGGFLLRAATDSIQYRRGERRHRLEVGITSQVFQDPEALDDGLVMAPKPMLEAPRTEQEVESSVRQIDKSFTLVGGASIELPQGSTTAGASSTSAPPGQVQSASLIFQKPLMRTEEEVDEEEEKAYFHVVVNAIDGLLVGGRTNEKKVADFALQLAASSLADLKVAQTETIQSNEDMSPSPLEDEAAPPMKQVRGASHASISRSHLDGSRSPLSNALHRKNPSEVQRIKLYDRTRMALVFVRVALTMVSSRQKPFTDSKHPLFKKLSQYDISGSAAELRANEPVEGHWAQLQNIETDADAVDEDEGLVRFSTVLRDCRTCLTLSLVELKYHVSRLKSQVAVYEKHHDDIVQLFARHTNTKVFGAVTAKDSRILQTLLAEDPELPDSIEEGDEARLINWSSRDPALRVLVLLSLANVLPSRHRRERLNRAMEVLKQLPTELRPTDTYSIMIIWSFAASTAGKLLMFPHCVAAKNVLYKHYFTPALLSKGTELSLEDLRRSGSTSQPFLLRGVSNLAIIMLSKALQDISHAEVRLSARRQLRFDKENPPDPNTLVMRPIKDWKWLHGGQVTSITCAHRSLFALWLLQCVSPESAVPLIFPCATQLYNILLPCLMDKHYSRQTLFPLLSITYVLLSLQGEQWSDPAVQYLGLRVLNDLKTNLGYAGVAGRGLSASEQESHKRLCQLLYITFAHVWNQIYLYPNARQSRYHRWITEEGMRSRYVYVQCASNILPEELVEEELEAGRSKPIKARGKEPTEPVDPEAESRQSPSTAVFPASQFLPSTSFTDLYDQMPVEFLELMEELLFHGPSLGIALLPGIPGSSSIGVKKQGNEKSVAGGAAATAVGSTKPPAVSTVKMPSGSGEEDGSFTLSLLSRAQTLAGIPPIIVEGVSALAAYEAGGSSTALLEALSKHTDSVLYCKVSHRVMEYLVCAEDYNTARRVGLNALEVQKTIQQKVDNYVLRIQKGFYSWLALNGYILADSRRIQLEQEAQERRQAETVKKQVKGKVGSGKSGMKRPGAGGKRGGKDSEQPEDDSENDEALRFFDLPRVWSSAEEQMLRQLTRALGWIRRRRAGRFLYRRITSYHRFMSSQIRLLLAAICQLESNAAERKMAYYEERVQYANARSLCGPSAGGGDGKGQTSTNLSASMGNVSSNSNIKVPAGKKGVVIEVQHEEEPTHVVFVRHCANAAVILNNAFLSSHSMRAVCMAIDELRNHFLPNVPDVLMLALRDTALLNRSASEIDLGSSGSSDNTIDSRTPSPGPNELLLSPSDVFPHMDDASNEKLKELNPLLIRLATELLYSLTSIQRGYCDHRRDIEVIQPAAMKAGQLCCLAEQIHYQGFVPSLYSLLSAAGQFEERRIARLAPEQHEKSKRVIHRRFMDCIDAEKKSREACEKAYVLQLCSIVEKFHYTIPSLRKLVDLTAVRQTTHEYSNARAEQMMLHSMAHRNGESYQALDDREAHATLRRAAMSCPAIVHFPFEEKGEGEVGATEGRIHQLQLGPDMPEEIIIEMVLYLASCLRFYSQREAVQLCVVANELTHHRFSHLLLPVALKIEDAIGLCSFELLSAYQAVEGSAAIGMKALVTARMNWKLYMCSPGYLRSMRRLKSTLCPLIEDDATPFDNHVSHNGNESGTIPFRGAEGASPLWSSPSCGGSMSVKAVLLSYHRAAGRLREDRDFKLLCECMLELGHIFLLHRNNKEAESCWLQGLDAALEIPKVCSTWRSTVQNNVSIEKVGLTRLLIVLCTLSSLSMYIYTEDQEKAVECYLFATYLVWRFFQHRLSLNFPANKFNFTDFVLKDLVIAPYMEEAIRPKLADITHHLLFLSHQLLQFGYHVFACMMSSFTAYFATRYEQHPQVLTEARLIHAKGSAGAGNFGSAMRTLRGVCQGASLPSALLSLLPLPPTFPITGCSSVTHSEKKVKVLQSSASTGGVSSSDRNNFTEKEGGDCSVYNDQELPTSPGNVRCVHAFLAECFPNLNVEQLIATNWSTPSASNLSLPSAFLHEEVCERYGTLLSNRVIIAVAEVLVALGSREAGYLWPFDLRESDAPAGRSPGTNREGKGLRGNANQKASTPSGSSSSGVRTTACVEALRAGEYLLEPFLQKENVMRSTSAIHGSIGSLTKSKPVKTGNSSTSKVNVKTANSHLHEREQDVEETQQLQRRCEEMACLRHHAVLLKAVATAERGNCTLSTQLLEDEIDLFNSIFDDEDEPGLGVSTGSLPGNISRGDESSPVLGDAKIKRVLKLGMGFGAHSIPNIPSFLLSLPHTFWCRVLYMLTVNYFRLRSFKKMEKAAQQAIVLCGQCHDTHSARVFSLYRATALAQTGYIKEAIETVASLKKVTARLSIGDLDGADPFHAWAVMSDAWLHNMSLGRLKGELGADRLNLGGYSPEGLSGALYSLREHANFCGILNWFKQGNTVIIETPQSSPFVWNNFAAVKLHSLMNISAELKLKNLFGRRLDEIKSGNVGIGEAGPKSVGGSLIEGTAPSGGSLLGGGSDLAQALDLLQEAIQGLSPQYDTQSHPTYLIQSKLLLALSLLCIGQHCDTSTGSLVSPARLGGFLSTRRRTRSLKGTRSLILTAPRSSGTIGLKNEENPTSSREMPPESLIGSHMYSFSETVRSLLLGSGASLEYTNNEDGKFEDVLGLLSEDSTKNICRILLDVAESSISIGTHDFRVLRIVLLELSVLLSRCGPGLSGVSASCAILAYLVQQMTTQVFSGANAFHIYRTEEGMTTELGVLKERFPDFLMEAIRSTISSAGQLTDQPPPERYTVPVSSFYQEMMAQESAGGNVGGGNRRTGRGNTASDGSAFGSTEPGVVSVSLQEMASTFATLHRETGLYMLAPPTEALDHETALLLLKNYIQEKTTAASCTYLLFPDHVRRQCAKQLATSQGKGQAGGTTANRNKKDLMAAQQQQENADFWSALVPPVLLKSLPPMFFAPMGPDTLGAPKINSVIVQSFSSASIDWLREGCEMPGLGSHELVTLVVAVSPFNDPHLTQAPPIGTPADRKKWFVVSNGTQTGSLTGHSTTPSSSSGRGGSTGTFKNRLAATPPTTESRVVYVDAALQDTLHELSSGDEGEEGTKNSGQWTCVSIELPLKVVEELRHQAQQVLHWLELEERNCRHTNCVGDAGTASAAEPAVGGSGPGLAHPPISVKSSSSAKGAAGAGSASVLSNATATSPSLATTTLLATLNQSLATLQTKMGLQQIPQAVQTPQAMSSGGGAARKGAQSARGGASEMLAGNLANGSAGVAGGGSAAASLYAANQKSNQQQVQNDLSRHYQQQQQTARAAESQQIKRSLDEAKSLFLMNFLESIIKSYVNRSMADESLMEACVEQLLPTCALSRDIVDFLAGWLARNGGASSFFHPGVHEWMGRIATFVSKSRKAASPTTGGD